MSKDFFLLHMFFSGKLLRPRSIGYSQASVVRNYHFNHFSSDFIYLVSEHANFCFKQDSLEGNSYGLPANIDWSSRINPNTKLFNLPLEVRNREHIYCVYVIK